MFHLSFAELQKTKNEKWEEKLDLQISIKPNSTDGKTFL